METCVGTKIYKRMFIAALSEQPKTGNNPMSINRGIDFKNCDISIYCNTTQQLKQTTDTQNNIDKSHINQAE